MPIDESHPIMNTPKENYRIWRYMDIPSFLSLLVENALAFSRADLMEDKYEGTLPKLSNYVIDQQAERMIAEGLLKPEYRNVSKFLFSDKSYIYLSCWCKEKTEMVHMWKIYSKESGIAIETSYEKLKGSIIDNEKVYPTDISYVDFDNEYVDMNANALTAYTIKRIEYKSESELRLIVAYPRQIEDQLLLYKDNETLKTMQRRKLYNSTPALKIKTDITKLIEKVHISPYAPKWYATLIKVTLDRLGLNNIPVVRSEL